jgi:hypothetical protein
MRLNSRSHWSVWSGVVVVSGLLLAACGGGSGGSSGTSTVGTVSGTAADGAPIANATVTVKDWNGGVIVTTTDANGNYRFKFEEFGAPYLILVDGGANAKYYGIAFNAGTWNVTLFSDLVFKSLCVAQDTSPDQMFADPAASPEPARQAVELLEATYRGVVATWLRAAGIDPHSFNLLETPFAASGTGFNSLLAMANFSSGTLTIDDGTTTQTSTWTGGPPSWFGLQTTINAPGGVATNRVETCFPNNTTSPLAGALTGTNGMLDALANVVNTRGAALTADDLLPYIAPNCLDDGMDRATLAANMATYLRTVHVDGIRVVRVYSWADNGRGLDAEFELTASAQGHTRREVIRENFLQPAEGQAFQVTGSGRIGRVAVSFERVTQSDAFGTQIVSDVHAMTNVPTGALANVSITSDDLMPIFQSLDMSFDTTYTEVFAPTPTTTLNYVQDEYSADAQPTDFPPAGTNFTFILYPAGSETSDTYEVVERGATSEPVALVAPTGHALADAQLGGHLSVTWQLPKSFDVTSIELSGRCADYSDTLSSSMESDQPIDPTDTFATLSFPANIMGTRIYSATFRLVLKGSNGESSVVNYRFADT